MAKRITKENRKILKRAKGSLVGGVDSPVRSFSYAEVEPLLIERGSGSKVYDYDGNKYVDYVLSWGAIVLGHAHKDVVRKVKDAAEYGFAFGTTNNYETELASIIIGAVPFIEKIRFVNSGTEAAMSALRLARGYTGRNKIIKFENAYHGHVDYLLTKGGSGLATLGIPSSAGVPEDFIKHTITTALNDLEAVKKAFEKYGDQIAAVLIEPVGGNYGVLPPDKNFLIELRSLTAKYGALLIFDEVITGFRFRFGSVAQNFGITPDLIILGKIIGGGLPIGAYGGRQDIMDRLAPIGDVYQASTFGGNPIVMAAGVATLGVLKRSQDRYEGTEDLARLLISGIEKVSVAKRTGLKITGYKNMFSLKFSDAANFRKFYPLMLDKGIYFAQSEFEANFLSFAHTKKDILKTADAVKSALERI